MRRALLGAAPAVALLGAFVACDDDDRYVYTGRRFDEANACLRPFTPIERVVGEGADVKCEPICFTFKDALYVSPVCPPLPVEATEVSADDDPRCQAALEASRTETFCEAVEDEDGGEDGGEEDAGSEEEDGSSDAGVVEDAAEEG